MTGQKDGGGYPLSAGDPPDGEQDSSSGSLWFLTGVSCRVHKRV